MIAPGEKKKIFVGLSGGVDSSVSAALLKEQGYDVTGVFIKVWQPEFISCTWGDDRRDAMRVCAHLDIPFRTLDLSEEYKRDVVDYMLREYGAGRTPNPDVMCNRKIKFGVFFAWAKEQGADCVATGHYAKVQKSKIKNQHDDSKFKSIYTLCQSEDKNKDQTYFLWTLAQEDLSRILFPIGGFKKPQVRDLAAKFGLITADKKDSQGVCFIGKLNMREFLKNYLPEKRGDVRSEEGTIVGFHEGAHLYTIGQRRGFTLIKKSPRDKPRYIIAKDVAGNTLTVSDAPYSAWSAPGFREVELHDANWIAGAPPTSAATYSARIRHRAPLFSCRVADAGEGRARVVFGEPQKALSPGQSLVLYDGEVCLGGGVIV